MYLIGLTAAYFLITRKVREKGLAITKDQIYDMVVWAALGVFIGGRIGYTLFYNFSWQSSRVRPWSSLSRFSAAQYRASAKMQSATYMAILLISGARAQEPPGG